VAVWRRNNRSEFRPHRIAALGYANPLGIQLIGYVVANRRLGGVPLASHQRSDFAATRRRNPESRNDSSFELHGCVTATDRV